MERIKLSERLYNITFYTKGQDSAQDNLIHSIESEQLLVHRHTNVRGRQWGLTTSENLLQICSKNRYLYEVLISYRQRKLYFDIDIVKVDDKLDDTLEQCKSLLIKEFPEAILQISGSRTPEKISYHIIISNWCADNIEDMVCLKELCTLNKHLGFDDKVYTKNRNMKLVNQSKPDGRIQEVIEGSDISKHFIMCYFDDDSFDIKNASVYKSKVNPAKIIEIFKSASLNIAELPQLNLIAPSSFNLYDNKTTSSQKMWMVPLYKRLEPCCLEFASISRICIWAKKTGLSFEQFWEWCKQKDNNKVRELKYRKFWMENSWYINDKLIEAILLRFYPNIAKNVATRRLIDNFEYINEKNMNMKVVDGMYLDSSCINLNTKYTILGSSCGSNKTGTIINCLKNKKCLMVTSRITLSQNVCKRLKAEGLNFVNYKDFDAKEKSKGILGKYDNIICSVSSLHYLFNNSFDVVVIDESESVLNTFYRNAETHGANCGINWSFLKNFVSNAERVYLMDAFTTKLTVDFIRGIEENAVIDYINTKPSDIQNLGFHRQIIQHETYDDWISEIKTSLKNSKKIFIFTSFKSDIKGVNALGNMLVKQFGWVENVDFISYHGDKTQEKKALYNCDEVWMDPRVKCVITNSCITIGVNFNTKKVFDKVFCLYNALVGSRDAIQAMYRVRFPNSLKMHFFHDKSYCKREYSEAKYEKPDCRIYRLLQENLEIEDDANTYECKLDTFKYFCKEANITSDWNKLISTNRANRIEIRRIMKDANIYAKWSSIKEITHDEMLEIGRKLNSNDDTFQMRLEFEKHNFTNKFKDEKDAERFWDAKKQKFVYRIIEFSRYPDNIIRRVYYENDMDITKPIKSNLKLHSITVEEVDDNFKFQNETSDFNFKHKQNGKNECDLIKKMINGYFGNKIVTLEKKDDKYVKVTVKQKRYLKLKTNKDFLCDVKDILDKIKSEYCVERRCEEEIDDNSLDKDWN